jgi:hypothetical protein
VIDTRKRTQPEVREYAHHFLTPLGSNPGKAFLWDHSQDAFKVADGGADFLRILGRWREPGFGFFDYAIGPGLAWLEYGAAGSRLLDLTNPRPALLTSELRYDQLRIGQRLLFAYDGLGDVIDILDRSRLPQKVVLGRHPSAGPIYPGLLEAEGDLFAYQEQPFQLVIVNASEPHDPVVTGRVGLSSYAGAAAWQGSSLALHFPSTINDRPSYGVQLYEVRIDGRVSYRSGLPHNGPLYSLAASGSLLYVGSDLCEILVLDISEAVPRLRGRIPICAFAGWPDPAATRITKLWLEGRRLIAAMPDFLIGQRLSSDGLSGEPELSLPETYGLDEVVWGRWLLRYAPNYDTLTNSLEIYDLEVTPTPPRVGILGSPCFGGLSIAVSDERVFLDCPSKPEIPGAPAAIEVVSLSDPTHPRLVGEIELPETLAHTISALADTLYVYTFDDRLISYDLTEPGVPPRLGILRSPKLGAPVTLDPASSIAFGPGRGYCGGAICDGLVALNLEDPRTVKVVGWYLDDVPLFQTQEFTRPVYHRGRIYAAAGERQLYVFRFD